ncbi:MAG TPA: urea carboxylase-associated family protein [Candidatus Binatia bacterium]|jgi:hypothetical protein
MNVIKTQIVPKNSGAAFEVKKGQRLRIAGKSIVDFVAFNLHDLNERFDQARTKTNQAKIFISTGDTLFSKRNNAMLTIVEDTFREGRHDLQKGMCSRKRFEMVAEGKAKRIFAEGVDINPKTAEAIPDHGCWENLSAAVSPWTIAADDVPSPFNIFQCMRIDPDTGVMFDTMIRPRDEAYVDFQADMDLLVAVSACPESGRGSPIRVEIFDGEWTGANR